MFSILCAADRRDLASMLFDKIKKDLDLGKQVVLVVPAQSSLSLEKEALKVLGAEGFFNLHIIRGQKLAETIQSQTRRLDKTPINTIGRSMLLRSIASKNKEKLNSFKEIAEDSEFLNLAGDFIVQLKQNLEDESTIDKLIQSAKSPILKGKLADMKVLLSEYQLLMQGKLTDSEDLVLHTAAMAKESSFIKESAIYYYGFYSFTSRELELLASIERSAKELNVALLLGEEEHFQITRKTLTKLQKKMPNAEILSAAKTTAPLCNLPKENVNIVCCSGPYSQALTIAADIKKNIRERKLEFSDFAVLTGANNEINSTLKRVFKEAGIPTFIDEKRAVLHSGGIDAVTAVLNLAVYNYKTKDAIRFLKSGVLGFEQNDIELFESYTKLYHIKQDKFEKTFKYGRDKYGDKNFEKLEQIRAIFFASTHSFTEAFNAASTVKEKSLALYNYLAGSINLPQKLSDLAKIQEAAGLVDAAEETKQVWNSLCSLLDQMTELLGEEIISGKDYSEMLINSLADIKVGVLPQAEGKVSIGSTSRSQIEEIKVLYIAGVNDNVIPSSCDPNGILTPAEIAGIEELGIKLAKDSDSLCEEENFCIYKALSAATDKLWLGYCMSDASGSDMKPSSLIAEFKELYPGIEIQSDILNSGDDLAFIEGKTLTLQKLSEEMRQGMENGSLKPLWKKTYNLVKDDANSLKEGLRFTNKKKALGIDLARKVFARSDNSYSLSPSRMDKFAACPFKHFVSYGLRPQEENEFGVNAGTIGDMHHEALLRLCTILSEKSVKEGFAITDERSLWMTISDDELEKILTKILYDIEENMAEGVMSSSKENEYVAKRTVKTCLKFAKHMVDQVRHSVIDEMYFEADFHRGQNFPAIEINTSAGKVFVEGRIDRVDVCPNDGSKYIRVIDYKSGQTTFQKSLVEKGLQLQLMIYLESAMNKYPDSKDGGVYYFHIKDNSVAATIEDFPKDEIAEKVLEKINKEYKLDGMEIDQEFKAAFSSKLADLCTSLTEGCIDATPKKFKSSFDSCLYCTYNSICHKDIV